MRRMEGGLRAAALAAALLLAGPADGQAGTFSSTSGVSVSTGDYGTGEDTTITQLYETLKGQGEKGEVGLTIPYLFRDGGGVTVGESRRATTGTIPEDADGIGDVQLVGKYYWLEELESRPAVDLAARVKFPTASDDDGLGTGRFDFGFGPELLKRFGSWITFGDFELVLRDKPDNSTLKSVRLDYSVGVGYPFTEKFTGYVSLDGGTPTNSGADAPLELVFSSVDKATEKTSIGAYVLAGLTEGSPDFGAGAEVTFRF